MRHWGKRQGWLVPALALFLVIVAFGYVREPGAENRAGTVELPALHTGQVADVADAAPTAFAQSGGEPYVLSDIDGVSRYMRVDEAVAVRAQPTRRSRIVARLATSTPEGTSNVVLALRRVERGGQLWIQARLPVLPNNTVGWIPRDALGGYNMVATHLVVDLWDFRAVLYRRGKVIWKARVGVGESRFATPAGRFYIRNRLTKYSSPTYGPVAFGTSARSPVLTDWPAGGFVGIHGTNRPALIPGRISHGCIRLRNADILRLDRLMPPGTPLTIRA